MLSFHGLVIVWGRFDFKYSFEGFMIRIASVGSGTISRRLEVDYMVNGVQWASCTATALRENQAGGSENLSRA
jgi:hypothetical protein